MSEKTGKPIPINWAKKIAEDLGYTQIIIHGYDGNVKVLPKVGHSTTNVD